MQQTLFCRIFFPTLLSTVLFSCNFSEATPPLRDPAGEKLNTYLNLNFGDSIPTARHLYILISKKNTKENLKKIVSRLNGELQDKNNYSSIVCANTSLSDSLKLSGKNYTDWDAAMDKLNFNTSCVTIVRTENKMIKEILPLSIDSTGIEKQFLDWQ